MVANVKPLHFGFGIIVMCGDGLIDEEHPKMSFQSKYGGLNDLAGRHFSFDKVKHLKENRLFKISVKNSKRIRIVNVQKIVIWKL